MEAKAKKGSLMKSFGKAAMVAVAAVGLSGCVTTGVYPGAGQYGSPVHGQGVYNTSPRGYQITYTPPRAPWANDPSFNREVSMELAEANMQVRLRYSNYQTRIANCNASFTRGVASNQRQIERNRRDGTSWIEAMGTGARINQTNATFEQCRINAQTAFQRSYISEQQSFNRQVETLNRKYARQYGVNWR